MAEILLEGLNGPSFRRLFYLTTINESTFPSYEEIPALTDQTIPWFMVLMLVEFCVTWIKGTTGAYFDTHDSMTSLGSGLLRSVLKLSLRHWEFTIYSWVHAHWRIASLPWDSSLGWIIAFLAVDLGFYWLHRIAHEHHILWGFHQMHHSSEYFNLTTALRQAMLQPYYSLLFHVPLALILPPSAILGHVAINFIFQFWVHTEQIGKLGPAVEYILNTPSHHRVHHGRNPYCIDKNYAGVLIIWDRMFGTFEPEREEEAVAYGLVHPVFSFNQLYLQLFAFKEALWDKPKEIPGWWNRLQSPFRDPGWLPKEVPNEGVPEATRPHIRYNPRLSRWPTQFYVWVHMATVLLVYLHTSKLSYAHKISNTEFNLCSAFVIGSLQTFGTIYEKRACWMDVELVRMVIVQIVAMAVWRGRLLAYPGNMFLSVFAVSTLFVQFYLKKPKQNKQLQHLKRG